LASRLPLVLIWIITPKVYSPHRETISPGIRFTSRALFMIMKGFIPGMGPKSFVIMGASPECVNGVIRVVDEVALVGVFHDRGQFGANSA